jgi:hypothetical protein
MQRCPKFASSSASLSRDVCSLSLRVLRIAPHPPDSGRSLPVPEHAIQSRAVRDVTTPWSRFPFEQISHLQDLSPQ